MFWVVLATLCSIAALQADFDLAAAEAGAPATFYCPISLRIFRDPVLLPTGQTYERSHLLRWLEIGKSACPATGQKIAEPVILTPNVALRKSIEEWCATHVPDYLDAEGGLTSIKKVDESNSQKISSLLQGNDGLPNGDLALAIQLQEEELERYSARRQQTEQSVQSLQERRNRGGRITMNLMLTLVTCACTAVFVLSIWQDQWQIETLNINPLVGPSPKALSKLGSRVSSKIVFQNQWWRVISSLFVSSGVIHLFSTVTCLWTLAKHLEYSQTVVLPCVSVPAVWLFSGVAGTLVSASLAFDLESAGATAGTCGLLGAVWAEQVLRWKNFKNHIATGVVLTLLTAMFVIQSLLPLVGLWCQAAAFSVGALLLPMLLVTKDTRSRMQKWSSGVGKSICTILLAGLIVIAVLSLVVDKARLANQCGVCHSIDCVNTRWWSCMAEVFPAQASCQISTNTNSTSTVTCPSGVLHLIATNRNVDPIATCNMACTTALAFVSPSAAPSSNGVLI